MDDSDTVKFGKPAVLVNLIGILTSQFHSCLMLSALVYCVIFH